MINLAIVDDQNIFLKGLRLIIDTFDSIQLQFEAKNGVELLDKLEAYQPHVILLDLQMPVMDGVTALKLIKEKYPTIKVILLTMFDDERLIQQVIELGANGYLLKNEETENIEKAIHAVVEKDFYLNDYVSKALYRGAQKKNRRQIKLTQNGIQVKLTKRELEVLHLICQEYNNAEIAQQLFLSQRTIEAHRRNMLEKTNVKNTAGLVIFAIRNELVRLS